MAEKPPCWVSLGGLLTKQELGPSLQVDQPYTLTRVPWQLSQHEFAREGPSDPEHTDKCPLWSPAVGAMGYCSTGG